VKLFDLPHVGTYKRRWVRRLVIIRNTPVEIVRAIFGVFSNAAFWWKQPADHGFTFDG
jgi:hypothetical protein